MRIACAIVAAGQGTRLGNQWSGTPKALVPVFGRPMLYYSLHAFDMLPDISEFVIAAPPEAVPKFQKQIRTWGFSKPINVVAGGSVRSDSVLNALNALAGNPPDFVAIHDAARACITKEMVEAILAVSKDGVAATLAHPEPDTLRLVENGFITSEIDREKIAGLETPQVFPYAKIIELHKSARGKDQVPDDTTLFTRSGEKVRVVYHNGCNMKITFPEDIFAVEGILYGRGWMDASEGDED